VSKKRKEFLFKFYCRIGKINPREELELWIKRNID
jgi:hypothetical protein